MHAAFSQIILLKDCLLNSSTVNCLNTLLRKGCDSEEKYQYVESKSLTIPREINFGSTNPSSRRYPSNQLPPLP